MYVFEYYCDYAERHYNSSLSSTYEQNGSYSNVKWTGINYSRYLSRNGVRLGGLKVQDQLFEEWTSASALNSLHGTRAMMAYLV